MLKVLVVEDEELIRKGIILTVDWASLDCVVVGEAANGEEALEAVERFRPSLIITDLKMPRMDGIELLRRLRGVSPLDSPDPCLFPLHRLTAFHRYIRVSEYHRFRGIKRIFTGFGADDPKSPPPFGRESIVPGYSRGQFHAEARTHFARPEGQKNRTKTALLCLAMRAAVRGEWG